MTEAKPLTLMQDEIAEIVHMGATENERRLIATLDERDEQIKRLRKLLIERGAASEALTAKEPPQ